MSPSLTWSSSSTSVLPPHNRCTRISYIERARKLNHVHTYSVPMRMRCNLFGSNFCILSLASSSGYIKLDHCGAKRSVKSRPPSRCFEDWKKCKYAINGASYRNFGTDRASSDCEGADTQRLKESQWKCVARFTKYVFTGDKTISLSPTGCPLFRVS